VEPRRDAPRPRNHSAAEYLTSSYYEIWIKGLEKMLLARRLVAQDELAAGRSLRRRGRRRGRR